MSESSRHGRRDVPAARSPGPSGTHITIRGLTKYFAGWPLYEDFDLDIPKHRIVSVFGPNGCGKSTLINMIAGLIPIDSGEILFDGKSLADTKIGYVFQNYREAMFPWMRTIDNIAYPLKLEGKSKAEVDRRMAELVASFDVKFDLNRYPYELSGGQQQTASIMRALAPNPEVLFLDEPFSALDFEMTLFIRDKCRVSSKRALRCCSSRRLAERLTRARCAPAIGRPLRGSCPTPPAPITVATRSEPIFIASEKRTSRSPARGSALASSIAIHGPRAHRAYVDAAVPPLALRCTPISARRLTLRFAAELAELVIGAVGCSTSRGRRSAIAPAYLRDDAAEHDRVRAAARRGAAARRQPSPSPKPCVPAGCIARAVVRASLDRVGETALRHRLPDAPRTRRDPAPPRRCQAR